MNTTVQSLQELYVKLGGSLTDTYANIADGIPVSDYVTIPDMIEACSQKAVPAELPAVTSDDNDKVLTVVNGQWDKAAAGGGGDFTKEDFVKLTIQEAISIVQMGYNGRGYFFQTSFQNNFTQPEPTIDASIQKQFYYWCNVLLNMQTSDIGETLTGPDYNAYRLMTDKLYNVLLTKYEAQTIQPGNTFEMYVAYYLGEFKRRISDYALALFPVKDVITVTIDPQTLALINSTITYSDVYDLMIGNKNVYFVSNESNQQIVYFYVYSMGYDSVNDEYTLIAASSNGGTDVSLYRGIGGPEDTLNLLYI